MVPRQRIMPLRVDVLDEVGDAFLDFDEILEELVGTTQTQDRSRFRQEAGLSA